MYDPINRFAGASEGTKPRVAIYARYSSDLQRPTSIEDQIRQCRAIAERNGWEVVDEFIRFDSEISGQSLAGRDGINELVQLAKTSPRPFEGIVIDDTSRFGRYLPDVVKMSDVLDGYGVFIHFGTQALDSRNPGFRQVFILYAMMDEQYVLGLRDKVHRGQHGRVLNGYIAGGKCYGYDNIPIEDPTRRGEYGRLAVIGVIRKKNPEQAAVVVRIFEMYAAGYSYARIAKTLNAEGVQSPQAPRKGKVRAWCPSAIREMLLNEKYRGVEVWNRTKTVRNREKDKTEQQPRPEAEWVRVEVPELRIVTDELWEAAREQNRRVREKHGPKRLGGMNRTEKSRRYLFSGLMECALCGKNITIISGKPPYARYGCPSHRFRGVCKNAVTITQRKLEQQLIAALTANLSDPRLEDERVNATIEHVKLIQEREAALVRQAGAKQSELKEERVKLKKQIANLVSAIAEYGMSSSLKNQLAMNEARLKEVERLLSAKAEVQVPRFSEDEIREFVRRKSQELADVLLGDPATAKQELQKRITKLVLNPKETPDGWVLEVSGDVALLSQPDSDVMLTNSREGIAEHYIHPAIPLTGVILDPSLDLTA